MTTIGSSHNSIRIDPNMPFLSGQDLMEEAMSLPKEEFSLGGGISVVRRGIMIRVNGSENMSPAGFTAALQASRMGGDAGCAMFDAYRHTNPEDFDGSRTFASILEGANRPPPPAPVARSAGANKPLDERVPTTKGTPGDDFLEAVDNANLSGMGGNDVMKAGDNSILDGGAGDDTMSAGNSSTLKGGDGNDTMRAGNSSTLIGGAGDDDLSAGHKSELYGGSGNDKLIASTGSNLYGEGGDDTLSAYGNNTLVGGDGDDHLSSYSNSVLDGGAGDDRLQAYENSYFDGGQGSDYISGYDDATIVDLEGNNYVSVYRRANVTTGDGNDWVSAYGNSNINAGNGNNMVTAYDNATVFTGDDADFIQVGRASTVFSGGGNDKIIASSNSIISGGAGNDHIEARDAVTIHFAAGDGHDIVSGSRWGHAHRQTDNLKYSVLAFGDGISAEGLDFQQSGNNLIISINGGADSVTLRDYQRHGIPSMTFADGTTISSQDITEKLGPGEAYEPESQVLQNWHDASAAYQASLGLAKNA
jgi:Ca2+-binding RTX toxin-like protein